MFDDGGVPDFPAIVGQKDHHIKQPKRRRNPRRTCRSPQYRRPDGAGRSWRHYAVSRFFPSELSPVRFMTICARVSKQILKDLSRSNGAGQLIGPWNPWIRFSKFGGPVWELVKSLSTAPTLPTPVRKIAILDRRTFPFRLRDLCPCSG